MPDAAPAGPHLGSPKTQKRVMVGALVAAGAFVAWRYYQASRTPPATPTDASVDPGTVTDTPGGSGGVSGNVQYSGTYDTNTATITTNSQWTQAAVDYLTNTAGYGAASVTEALGNYLAGNGLTDAQITIVQAALAAEGRPPQGTYTIKHAVTQTKPSPSSQVPLAPTGLAVTQHDTHGVRAQWQYVPGATDYQVSFDGQYWSNTGGKNAYGAGSPRPGAHTFVKGQHVRVFVRATNSKGRGPITDTVVTIN